MSKSILILPGDGIGQEVTTSMVEVLNFLIEKYSLDFVVNIMSIIKNIGFEGLQLAIESETLLN